MSSSIPLPALYVKPYPNALDEYLRSAELQQQLSAQKQQQQQEQQAFPLQQQARQLGVQQMQQENQMRQMQMQDQQALRDLAPGYVERGEDGKVKGYDWDGFFRGAAEKGVSPQTLQALQKQHLDAQQSYLNLDKAQREREQSNNEWMFQTIEGLKGIADPNQRQAQYMRSVQEAQKRGMDVAQFPPQAPSNDELTALEAPLGMHAEILKNAKTEAETKKALRGEITEQEYQAYMQNPRLDPQLHAAGHKDAATFAAWRAKQSPMGIVLGNQLAGPSSDAALDQAAERYRTTGELPAGFARSPGTITAIMNRAAKQDPSANIAGNKAVYGANKTALSQLQAQASKVNAFEATAGKNLDVFLKQAEKITDAGAKFVNVPIRMVQRGMLGTADMAAFDAARTTALTEIAKVLNSPTGAGVLSDSARHEVEGLIGENATLASIKSAAQILKQDMHNRHESYQQEINNLQKQLGGQSQGESTPESNDPFAKFGGKKR